MEQANWKSGSAGALLAEFFAQDDLKALAADAGALLECPLLVLDDTFHVMAHHRPLGFTDPLFQDVVRQGEITYEAGAIISQSEALSAGREDYIKLDGSDYRRRFAPLISSGVQLGYFICVDTDGHLQSIPPEIWNTVEQVLAKQAFIEASRQDKPFETAEDILMHLLDGGFSSAPYFRLQASGTYLADFHPTGFALIDLAAYHNEYLGKRHLKDELWNSQENRTPMSKTLSGKRVIGEASSFDQWREIQFIGSVAPAAVVVGLDPAEYDLANLIPLHGGAVEPVDQFLLQRCEKTLHARVVKAAMRAAHALPDGTEPGEHRPVLLAGVLAAVVGVQYQPLLITIA